MNIADELRKYASDAVTRKDYMAGLAFDLNRIADRIDAEHEKTIQQVLMGDCGVPATDELKPCPFCRGKVGWDNGSIYCPKCNFRFRPSWSSETCERRWNRRADDE